MNETVINVLVESRLQIQLILNPPELQLCLTQLNVVNHKLIEMSQKYLSRRDEECRIIVNTNQFENGSYLAQVCPESSSPTLIVKTLLKQDFFWV